MQQGKKARRAWPFVVAGAAVIIVVGAVLLIPRLLTGQDSQATGSVIAYATATVGDVSTTVSGSGTLAETGTDISVPIGITISDVYVRAGDTVAAGDVLAAVDSDSTEEAISLVNDEIAALAEASSALGGSATIDRIRVAYEDVLSTLNEIYATGYIRATVPGTIDSVNVQKDGTVTASTGSSGSASSTSASSGASGSVAGGGVSSGVSATADGGLSPTYAYAVDRSLSPAYVTAAETPGLPEEEGGPTKGEGNEGDTDADYALNALPFTTTTVSQVKAACVATATATREEATKAYLINLCEARAWHTADPTTPLAVSVEVGSFAPEKGVYPVTFGSPDDPTLKAITYVVVEDDSGSGAGSGATGGAGSGATGSSGSSATANTNTEAEAETPIDSMMAPAFRIRSESEMEVQIQLDELDVASVRADQPATVELSALEGQVFEGTVSSVTSSSGSYYAVVAIEKVEGMYVGFSATATIVKEQASGAVIIPLGAVQQQGGELFVYTTATEDGELGGATVIETGLSDESTVEVLSGLSEGVTVYYQQQVTTDAASTGTGTGTGASTFGRGQEGFGSGFGGGTGGAPMPGGGSGTGSGGAMPSGTPPSG